MKTLKKEHFIIGCITCCLVGYAGIGQIIGTPDFWLIALAYSVFFVLFCCYQIASTNENNDSYSRCIAIVIGIIAEVILIIHPGPVAPALLVLWATLLPECFSYRASVTVVVISNICFIAIMHQWWEGPNRLVFSTLFLGFQIFALSITANRNNEAAARMEITKINQQLISTRILLAQSYKQEERLRISRDLHDIIGHKLTALKIQLELLEHKIDKSLYQDVKNIKNISKELLESIRKVVRDQREISSLNINKAIEGIISLLPHLDLEIEGYLNIESPQLAEQVILCIQEGITNAIKHGNATKLKIYFQQEHNNIKILLDDNGYGFSNKGTTGNGIIGMNERLHHYKGRAELIPLIKGCRLLITLGEHYDYRRVGGRSALG